MKKGYGEYQSILGTIRVIADETGVKRVEIFEEDWQDYLKENPDIKEDHELCGEAIRQLDEYFNKERRVFDLPLSLDGTDFRKKVWKALQTIPYGEVRSYAEVAEMIGNPKAVGQSGRQIKQTITNYYSLSPSYRQERKFSGICRQSDLLSTKAS